MTEGKVVSREVADDAHNPHLGRMRAIYRRLLAIEEEQRHLAVEEHDLRSEVCLALGVQLGLPAEAGRGRRALVTSMKGDFFSSPDEDRVIACVQATGFAESKTGYHARKKIDIVVFDKRGGWFDAKT